jgi:hypothetical protein
VVVELGVPGVGVPDGAVRVGAVVPVLPEDPPDVLWLKAGKSQIAAAARAIPRVREEGVMDMLHLPIIMAQ